MKSADVGERRSRMLEVIPPKKLGPGGFIIIAGDGGVGNADTTVRRPMKRQEVQLL